MSRVTYHSAIELVESYKITYRIYVLKNPNTNTVFYVGKTMKDLKERLTGHIGSIKTYGANKEKSDIIQSILAEGKKPIIEEIEVISGTCYIDGVYASYREFYWMNYYRDLGVSLSNHIGIKTDATCKEYDRYTNDIKEGKGFYHYYYVGQTKHGIKVYDGERMEEDGFIFENEYTKTEDLAEPYKETITYEPIYDDENPNYIRLSLEEI